MIQGIRQANVDKEVARLRDKTRLIFLNGRVVPYDDPKLAYAVWIALPRGVRVAFRSAGDTLAVRFQDYVDRP